jgi:hypothetical protein
VDVTIRCVCSGHHPFDTVTLRDRLDFRTAFTIRNEVAGLNEDGHLRPAEALATLTECYVVYGVESWSLTEEDKPLPVSREAIEQYLLSDPLLAMPIADAADSLYSATILPLVVKVEPFSKPTRTRGSTSAKRTRSTAPKHSSRSSTTTTPTAAIGTTS